MLERSADPGPETAGRTAPQSAFRDDEDSFAVAYRRDAPREEKAPRPSVEPPPDIWQQLRCGFRITSVEHPRVEAEIGRLLRHPAALQALLERATPFLGYILEQVEARGLPTEIALLPAVESGYRPFAYSPEGAAGLWQFMPATARHFGLEIGWWTDARRDPVDATRAALDYIELLARRFDGDMLLALAAYNAGGAKVAREVRKNRKAGAPENYWNLSLPRETDQYVPRLLALARIIEQPQLFGVSLPDLETGPLITTVDTGGQIDLGVAAQLADLPLEELVSLNAGLNRSATPPTGPHRLVIPNTAAAQLASALVKLPDAERMRWDNHTIRAGDTLGGIAHRYGVDVAAIREVNGLSGSLIRAGDTLRIPLSTAVAGRFVGHGNAANTRVSYRVRKGDSLYVIARRFEVSVGDLRRWNGISGRLIKPGQQLTVYVRGDASRL
jgi:membrane-bound lytic murein transglycosylase D